MLHPRGTVFGHDCIGLRADSRIAALTADRTANRTSATETSASQVRVRTEVAAQPDPTTVIEC